MAEQSQPKPLKQAERRKFVWEYLLEGLSLRQIADKMAEKGHSISFKTVANDRDAILSELQDDTREDAANARKIDLGRIEELIQANWKDAKEGKCLRLKQGATETIARLIDRRAKLYGYAPPDKLALTDPTGEHEANLHGKSAAALKAELAELEALEGKLDEQEAEP